MSRIFPFAGVSLITVFPVSTRAQEEAPAPDQEQEVTPDEDLVPEPEPRPETQHERLLRLSTAAATAEERGELLFNYTCLSCHSRPNLYSMAHHDAGAEFIHLGGGRDMPTIFGTFYAPNISVHPEDGIGSWTEEDFFRALRQGIAPDGRTYWPSFPYMAYTKLSDGDIHDLWAYIQTQPAVESDVLPHDPKFKRGVAIWRWKEFDPGAMEADSERSEAWNRGRYLVEAVGYCDQCHTPRRKTGFLIDRYYLAGGANPGKAEIHANLTPDPEFGLAEWTEDDFVEFLTTAETADGQMMEDKYIMYEKIIDGYRYMPESDKRAIAVYLMALEPINFDPEAFFEDW